ncbi:MAG TPA: hypothetical protein VE891_00660 [Allosphingosinicella sp.]|nr:hypothetical protein [Allosphingosinicella sp.]
MGAVRTIARLVHPQQLSVSLMFGRSEDGLMAAGDFAAGSDREYHVERARAELDAAYRAVGRDSAQAHLRLCSMHMAKAKVLLERTTQRASELEWIESCRPLHERCLASAR